MESAPSPVTYAAAGVDITAGVVHLNDSAGPHPDTVVSVETFDAAWRTSDHAMVVAG